MGVNYAITLVHALPIPLRKTMNILETAKQHALISAGLALVAIGLTQGGSGNQSAVIRETQRNAILEQRQSQVLADQALARFQQNPICAHTLVGQLPRGLVIGEPAVDPVTKAAFPDGTVFADHFGSTGVIRSGLLADIARADSAGNLQNPCRLASANDDHNIQSQNQEIPVQPEPQPSRVPDPGIVGVPSNPQ